MISFLVDSNIILYQQSNKDYENLKKLGKVSLLFIIVKLVMKHTKYQVVVLYIEISKRKADATSFIITVHSPVVLRGKGKCITMC